jgi:hypothetical protein
MFAQGPEAAAASVLHNVNYILKPGIESGSNRVKAELNNRDARRILRT